MSLPRLRTYPEPGNIAAADSASARRGARLVPLRAALARHPAPRVAKGFALSHGVRHAPRTSSRSSGHAGRAEALRRELLSRVIPLLAVKQFDRELLVVPHHLGYRRIVEALIELSFKFESSSRPVTAPQVLWDTAAILYRLNILRCYDRRAELAIERRASLPPWPGSGPG